jgi:UDP-3-O-[3-hydroxymyristoyl] N-acetylglucosamine deacetylase
MQITIRKEISAEGVGIHYNKFAKITLKPASEDVGIVFKRIDVTGKNNEIEAIYTNIDSISLSTQLKNGDGVFVATVEHLMSAVSSFNISNLIIEISESEVPIMDGGSEDFSFLIECAGLKVQHKPAKKFKLLKEIKVGNDENYIIAKPSEEQIINFTSNFNSKKIGEQSFSFNPQKDDFVKEISSSKTIANAMEVEMLRKAGMGLGGSLKNTLVFNENDILNEMCLYNVQDFVKHKVLDFMGDIKLAGGEIIADFSCYKSGHKLNHMLLNEIFKSTENYQLI